MEGQWTWVNICLCRAAYLVEIYWLLQACHRDHFETGEAPKKDARPRQPVSAKCHLPPGEILGYVQCTQITCVPTRAKFYIPKRASRCFGDACLFGLRTHLGKTWVVSERILRELLFCQTSLTRGPGK